MSDPNVLKQSCTGFKVVSFTTKGAKDGEKLKLVLMANIEDLRLGEYEISDLLNSLLNHRISDSEIGLSVFVNKK